MQYDSLFGWWRATRGQVAKVAVIFFREIEGAVCRLLGVRGDLLNALARGPVKVSGRSRRRTCSGLRCDSQTENR